MASSQVSSLHSDMAHHPRQVHHDLLAQNDRCRGEYAKRGGSRRSRPAVPIGRLATTSLRRLRSRTVLRSGGGRLTRLVEHAPPWATCQAGMARSTAEEV